MTAWLYLLAACCVPFVVTVFFLWAVGERDRKVRW